MADTPAPIIDVYGYLSDEAIAAMADFLLSLVEADEAAAAEPGEEAAA